MSAQVYVDHALVVPSVKIVWTLPGYGYTGYLTIPMNNGWRVDAEEYVVEDATWRQVHRAQFNRACLGSALTDLVPYVESMTRSAVRRDSR